MVNLTSPTASSKSICRMKTCSDAFATYDDVEKTQIFLWQISHLLANASQLVIARAVATSCYVSELHHPGG